MVAAYLALMAAPVFSGPCLPRFLQGPHRSVGMGSDHLHSGAAAESLIHLVYVLGPVGAAGLESGFETLPYTASARPCTPSPRLPSSLPPQLPCAPHHSQRAISGQ